MAWYHRRRFQAAVLMFPLPTGTDRNCDPVPHSTVDSCMVGRDERGARSPNECDLDACSAAMEGNYGELSSKPLEHVLYSARRNDRCQAPAVPSGRRCSWDATQRSRTRRWRSAPWNGATRHDTARPRPRAGTWLGARAAAALGGRAGCLPDFRSRSRW